jgi:AraC-like DNA-binding protein
MSEAADRWRISTWASTMTCMTRSRNSLAAGIALLAPREGGNETRYPGVSLYRFTVPEPPTRYVYPSSLVLVGAGRKQVSLGNKTLPYDAGHYLVVTSPMPILCRTIASADEPVLSMVVEIELALLREMVLEFERSPRAAVGRSTHTVFSAPLPRDLEDAAARLLACLADERRTRALARQTIREMLFLVLDGPQGDSLRALAEGPASQLADVVREMNARFAERRAIGDLAQMARMSVPTFHQHFKAMTGTSPLQYMKAVRLIRARQMLLGGGMVKTVAHDVGYESETQFSREYRRFFGSPPSHSHEAPHGRSQRVA